jgi:hypothetical protein
MQDCTEKIYGILYSESFTVKDVENSGKEDKNLTLKRRRNRK